MFKKAGIIVAAAAAGLLAVSPLAFAGDKDDHHHGHDGDSYTEINEAGNSSGLVNVADNNVNVPVQACNNDVPVNVLGVQVSDVQADLTGALGFLAEDVTAEDEGGAGDVRECSQESEIEDSIELND